MIKRRLFLIAHGLQNRAGHHYMEARSFMEEVEKHGAQAEILCHRDVDEMIRGELRAQAVFSRSPYGRPPRAGRIRQRIEMWSYAITFMKGMRAWNGEPIGADDLVVSTLTKARDLLGLAYWLRSLPANRRPHLSLNFMIDDITEPIRDGNKWRISPASARAYRRAFKSLAKHAASDKLSLTAGGASYAEVMSDMLGSKVSTAPLPVQLDVDAAALSGTQQNPVPVLAYLGHMNPLKGTDLIGPAIRRVLQHNTHCHFVLQANPESLEARWEEEIGIEGMRKVTIHKGEMQQEAYQQAFCSADIILLPYRATEYRLRTSGIFAEAMALGKVAVVPEYTWMAEMTKSQGSGAVIYREQSEQCVAMGILEALKELPRLRQESKALSHHWREEKGMKAYVKQVLRAVDKTGPRPPSDP